jgi:YesN/AraC family two-component response regulator
MTKHVSLEVSDEIVKPIIEREIQAAMVKALGKQEDLIAQIARSVLATKVDDHGNVNEQNYYNKHDLVETTLSIAIREQVKEAIQEWVNSNTDVIRKQVEKEFSTQRFQKEMRRGLADSVIRSMQCKWNTTVNVRLKPGEDD